MAWNEPGNGNNTGSGGDSGKQGNGSKDPWGGGNNNGDDGPPDLDEALKQFQKRLGGLFGGGSNNGSNNGAKSGRSGGGFSLGSIALFAVVVLVLWAISGVYQVDQQEEAVVLRLGKYHVTNGAGLHWNPKFVDQVFVENVTRVRSIQHKANMLTEDENIVDVELSVQYTINDLQKFVLANRTPEISLRHATESALRHVVGGSKMDDVLTAGREQIAIDVQIRLQNYVDLYLTGVQVAKVNIEDTAPPQQVRAAFDDVIKAREDKVRERNQADAYANQIVPEARGKAQRQLQEATAYKVEVVARAEGEAERFEKILLEYRKAPEVTRERLYIDTVQQVMSNSTKVLVDVDGGNNMLYLPLDKLMQQSASSLPGNDRRVPTQISQRPRVDSQSTRRREVR